MDLFIDTLHGTICNILYLFRLLSRIERLYNIYSGHFLLHKQELGQYCHLMSSL